MNLARDISVSLYTRQQLSELIEQELSCVFSKLEISGPLRVAIEYAVFPGGKRIRPLFCLLCAQDLGVTVQSLVRAALALELFHCATLIHDDLPALDNDDFRRGLASCHKVFGEATAIIAGDYLSVLAFDCLSGSELDPLSKTKMLNLISKSFMEVCAGQQLDLVLQQNPRDLAHVHRLKTASLFRAALGFAAVVSKVEAKVFDEILNFGTWTGLGFQVLNDLMDIYGTEQERGRPLKSDKNKQTNLSNSDHEPSLLCLLKKVEEEATKSLSRLEQFPSLKGCNFRATSEIFLEIISGAKVFQARGKV